MKTYNKIYEKIISLDNLFKAWKKARKGKTKRDYVIEFERNLIDNLMRLHKELKELTYEPKPLETFILRDPKTRKISKSDFRDRIVHHALCNVIEPIFDKAFIHDSCANRKGKGNLFAINRFDKFKRKVSINGIRISDRFNNNNLVKGYCLKADIRHYFDEVDHGILLKLISRKIKDRKVINLINKIIKNYSNEKGMPLGNLTSQFFANIYLNELDYFVKHKLKIKYYVRYVDDFVILDSSKETLQMGGAIDSFLREKLKLELHPEKSRIIPLAKGIDFVGFRNFYHFKLLRKRNVKNMKNKIKLFSGGKMSYEKLIESFEGWKAYAKWANSRIIMRKMARELNKTCPQAF